MRVAGFFIYCFASLLVPVGCGFALMAFRAPTYRVVDGSAAIESGTFVSLEGVLGDDAVQFSGDLRDEHPSSLAAAGAAYEDTTLAFVVAFVDAKTARESASSLVDRIPTSSRTGGPGGARYTRSDTGAMGLVRAVGRLVVWVQGPNRDLVDSRFTSLPSVEHNPDRNFANGVIDENFGLFVGVMLVWVALQIFIWPRYASSAGTARAPADRRVNPASASALLALLTALEEAGSPLRVTPTERDNELLVDWRYDSGTWASLMAAGKVNLLRRLRLRLQESSHRVLVRDEQSEVSWEVGADGRAVAADFRWKAMWGIVFLQVERTAQFGLELDDGIPRFGKNYEFKFDVRELRAPVIAVLNGAGWDYRPVMAFNRFFGG